MLCDIDARGLAEAADKLQAGSVQADVSLKGDLEKALQATRERLGKLHILVNNAGVGGGSRYGSWTDAGWSWVLDVNLRATVWGIELFGPLLEEHGQGGHIVNTASVTGLFPQSSSPYCVTKYAVVALSEALRRELAPRRIGVSVLCPGLVRTGLADSDRNAPERFRQQDLGLGSPDYVKLVRAALVVGGVDPAYVGDLVVQGIQGNWPYIFTDLESEAKIEERFAAIRQSFDRLRAQSSLPE
jgi:NAD(P)-dependent dehydrogenase (short-subunit alcohol dehydrogenase family)